MTPKINFKMIMALLVFASFFTTTSTEAQIWKRLKKKAKEKLKKTEDKLLDKLDKKTDKVLYSTIDGTGKTKKNSKVGEKRNVNSPKNSPLRDEKSYG